MRSSQPLPLGADSPCSPHAFVAGLTSTDTVRWSSPRDYVEASSGLAASVKRPRNEVDRGSAGRIGVDRVPTEAPFSDTSYVMEEE